MVRSSICSCRDTIIASGVGAPTEEASGPAGFEYPRAISVTEFNERDMRLMKNYAEVLGKSLALTIHGKYRSGHPMNGATMTDVYDEAAE